MSDCDDFESEISDNESSESNEDDLELYTLPKTSFEKDLTNKPKTINKKPEPTEWKDFIFTNQNELFQSSVNENNLNQNKNQTYQLIFEPFEHELEVCIIFICVYV